MMIELRVFRDLIRQVTSVCSRNWNSGILQWDFCSKSAGHGSGGEVLSRMVDKTRQGNNDDIE